MWASWNGATEVRRWRILAGDSPSTLEPVDRTFRFVPLETTMQVATTAGYLAVEALDSAGAVMGRSRAEKARQ